jgi:hypothetical protein
LVEHDRSSKLIELSFYRLAFFYLLSILFVQFLENVIAAGGVTPKSGYLPDLAGSLNAPRTFAQRVSSAHVRKDEGDKTTDHRRNDAIAMRDDSRIAPSRVVR